MKDEEILRFIFRQIPQLLFISLLKNVILNFGNTSLTSEV